MTEEVCTKFDKEPRTYMPKVWDKVTLLEKWKEKTDF